MTGFEKGGIPTGGDFFICTSEQENKIVGTFNNNGFPHQSTVIPESIALAVRMAIEKECETIWQNDHH